MAYTQISNFDPAVYSWPDFIDETPYAMGAFALDYGYDDYYALLLRENSFSTVKEEIIISTTPNFPALRFLPFKRPVKGHYAWAGLGSTARPNTGYLYPRKSTV